VEHDKKLVVDYLENNYTFYSPSALLDRLSDITTYRENVPKMIRDAYFNLPAKEKWQIIHEISAKGIAYK
jgi:predicted nucleotidyltransferase